MKDVTRLIRHKISTQYVKPVSTPIFQTSAFKSGDPYFYTRKSNPNFAEVEEIFCELEAGEKAVLLSSGMTAISAALHLLSPDDRLLVNKLIYGCSYRFFCDFCQQFKITLEFVDLSTTDGFSKLDTGVDMVFLETPTNPFLKTIDIKEVSERVKKANPKSLVVVDNTWATSLFQKPLKFGADISLHSNSKFNGGHSDMISGIAITNNAEIGEKIAAYRFYNGCLPDPFSAWLLRRSLQTLGVRLERQVNSTAIIANYLKQNPLVDQVFFPNIDGKQLTNYGGLIFFHLQATSFETVKIFMSELKLFDEGTSMASVTSAVANPWTGSHLSMSEDEKRSIGLDEFIVRLSFGLEDVDDLINDIERAFSSVE
jgi:cystathionine gamma-lyase/cystathionine gamma-lyase/homocysteine desulfhydrase